MTMTSDNLDAEIRNDKQLTSRPFGVDSVAPVRNVRFGRPIGGLETNQRCPAHLSTDVNSSRVSPCKAAWMII